jgi:hypothetical protein
MESNQQGHKSSAASKKTKVAGENFDPMGENF